MSSDAYERLGKLLGNVNLAIEDYDLIFADANRVEEFCILYERSELSDEEKQILMRIIVSSLDDLLRQSPSSPTKARVRSLLLSDMHIHKNVIDYWAAEHHSKIVWKVTPMMRRIKGAKDAT